MVPNGWKQTTLDKVLTIGGGKDYKHLEEGSIPVYGSGGYMLSVSDYLYDGESVCIGRKGTIDKPIFLKGKFWTVDTLFYTHSFKDSEPYYIYQFFQTVPWRRLNEASGVPSLAKSIINKVKINLPPLPEQRKIAKILSTWDKAIATTEKLIDASQQQKKALMQQLLTGKKRLVNPETGKAFEGEWEEVPLSNWLVEFKEKSSAQDQHRVYTSSRSGLVPQDEYFGNSRISDRKNIGFHILPPGHMTYRSRSDDGYFTFNLFKGNENGIISHYYPVFTSKGSNDFFIALLEQYRNVFGKHSVGTSQKVLSFNALKAIRFFVPSTYEQQKIASVLIAADKEIELLQAKLAHLKDEKKALMQQLLTGKRRVKVDENVAA
ncbi:restriction endonuclease subunit S [Providencia stuartii]|uniref:Type I restriction modification DNA specificity domain protein n=1 Tax=Providencia stuartii ATCC 25827 TaxID=471874 RepID=A0AA86YNL8_PROST|nr:MULTISPECIES: restriction endonuclease subunit S [Providencia]EDU61071.1 type I restriction modification DNA specificity domain protein [Providencia stuartii ATCC 25827]MBS7784341.1 restriction endonuclease subunit S [Providencia thailandensis]MTC81670.1 restriction endonuclease subunit S [Providencia stuartii]